MQSFILQIFGKNEEEFVMCLFRQQAISFPSYQGAPPECKEREEIHNLICSLLLFTLIPSKDSWAWSLIPTLQTSTKAVKRQGCS